MVGLFQGQALLALIQRPPYYTWHLYASYATVDWYQLHLLLRPCLFPTARLDFQSLPHLARHDPRQRAVHTSLVHNG